MGPRETLNRLKWCNEMKDVKITIIHRGAPGDRKTFTEDEIVELGRSFMRVRSSSGEVEIPYHRIVRIEIGGKVIWER
ncbi:MAG: RNA repair domain-containing protein [Candidatus Hadarchaeales archaeon]